MIEAVVFDVGGVLTTSPVDEFARVDREHGLPDGTVQSFFRGGRLFARVEVGLMPVLEFHRQTSISILDEHGVSVPPGRLEHMLETCMGGVMQPGMVELVEEVKAAGYQTGLLTNIFAERRAWLHGLFPAGVIDVYCDSSEVGLRKPDPRIYERLLTMLGRPAGEVLLVDDFPENLEPARALGIVDVRFHDTAQTRAALVDAGVRIPGELVLGEAA